MPRIFALSLKQRNTINVILFGSGSKTFTPHGAEPLQTRRLGLPPEGSDGSAGIEALFILLRAPSEVPQTSSTPSPDGEQAAPTGAGRA